MRAAADMGRPMALATLYAVSQGGPRPLGSQMLFSADVVAGFLSGGCIEADIAVHAEEVIGNGQPRHLVYGEGSPWPDIQLLCGARLDILVERLAPDEPALLALLEATEARRPGIWVTDGRIRGIESALSDAPQGCETRIDPFELRRFYAPTPRLVVVGSDPIALAVASLGAQSGFQTWLVRPKGPVAPPPIAGLAYTRASPFEALAAIAPDPWTAVAVATHEAEIDHDALLAALQSEASYVGVVGARRRLPERLTRLRNEGVSERALDRLHAPIGLDLGGKAPWEVAVSVVAEIIAYRARRPRNAG
jgi:xanthine dehydrogenase accessory factor